ncbi:MAG: gluconeogenesis factor YvcK family protein [Patescibacteria group bacterium]
MRERKRIAVLGGGTGTFTVLNGLKHHPVDISAVVSIADSGGSTGVLRDELGVLPPGDVRQALTALAEGDDILRSLFTYRFQEGSLAGHNFGNLFLSVLEKVTGDPLAAISEAHRILKVHGRVIPVSAQSAELNARLIDGTVLAREHIIDQATNTKAINRCFLTPEAEANPEALAAIEAADTVIIGPGDLYTSLVPVLLVKGITSALTRRRGRTAYVLNLTTKPGLTQNFKASDFVHTLSEYLAPAMLDAVIVNNQRPHPALLEKYRTAGEELVEDDLSRHSSAWKKITASLLSHRSATTVPGDQLHRSLLRHDSAKLASAILKV